MSAATVHVCQECGFQARKWLGKCPECGRWGTLVEEVEPTASARSAVSAPRSRPIPYPEISPTDADRTPTRIAELDRVLGGGLVRGAVVLLGGEPGIGKSTLLLQTASRMAEYGQKVLYATAEESAAQLRLRGDRIGVRSRELAVLPETDVDAIIASALEIDAAAMIVDSIQAVRCADLAAVPGSVSQVRECAARLVSMAKSAGIPLLLVGHVTKDGTLAGPRLLEHMVDAVLHFEGDRHLAHRLLRSLKNRFGPSDELAVFSMSEDGLRAITSPSELFLAERPLGAPGSVVLPAMEGSRPLLVEVQSLVGEPVQGTPRRTASGVDPNRLALILAVLERRAGCALGNRDVFVNVTGGLVVVEPGADLAIAAAAASSLEGTPLPCHFVVVGEIGLTGEIRSVARLDARLKEAARLGFEHALVPASASLSAGPDGITLHPVRHLEEALETLRSTPREGSWPAGLPARR